MVSTTFRLVSYGDCLAVATRRHKFGVAEGAADIARITKAEGFRTLVESQLFGTHQQLPVRWISHQGIPDRVGNRCLNTGGVIRPLAQV